MSCAGFLLDSSGRVVKANRGGERLLEGEFRLRQGRLTAPDHQADRALQEMLRKTPGSSKTSKGNAVSVPRDGGLPLMMRSLSVSSASSASGTPTSLVIIVDPEDCPPLTRNAFRELFGLTDAEIHVAASLMCGYSPVQIAKSQNKCLGTVRQQLKSIYAKTQTKRQSELVALLSRLSVAFAFEKAAA
jgi:DNA-binding CsgD family transcriptional regulator